MPRTQVLICHMPQMLDDLLRSALADTDVELVPRGTSVASLRTVGEHEPPPVLLVASTSPGVDRFEREVLRPHPEALILRVERDGRVLSSTSLEVGRHHTDRQLTTQSLIDAIEAAPSWRARFD